MYHDVLMAELFRRKRAIMSELGLTGSLVHDKTKELIARAHERFHQAAKALYAKPMTVGELRVILGDWPNDYTVWIVQNRLRVYTPGSEPRTGKKRSKRHDPSKTVRPKRRRRARGARVPNAR